MQNLHETEDAETIQDNVQDTGTVRKLLWTYSFYSASEWIGYQHEVEYFSIFD
jgi:hypothetical protein